MIKVIPERPRVAMLVHAYYLRDARVRRYAEALVREGIETDVFCLRDQGEAPREIHEGVSIIRVPFKRVRGGKVSYYVEYASTLALLGVYLNAFHLWRRYGVVHVHTPPDALVMTVLAPRMSGAKVILDFHDLMPELFVAKYKLTCDNREVVILKVIEKMSASMADTVITACSTFKDNLLARGVPEEKVSIIRNLPDPRLFEERRKTSRTGPKDEYRLLYIGTISERYGVDLGIRALDRLRHSIPGIRLRIVGKITGEGEYKQFLYRLAEERGVLPLIDFAPPVPLQDVAEEMGNCDVGFYTPIHDVHMDNAFSLKAGEFAAMGVPMVTTRTPVMEKTLGADGAAYIESGDVTGFVSEVIRLYSEAAYRNRIIAAGEEFTAKNHWHDEKASYIGIVQGLLSRPEQPLARARARGFAKRNARRMFTGVHRNCRKLLSGNATCDRKGVRILTYHDVSDSPDTEWSVASAHFGEQMRFLSDNYPLANLDEVRAWLLGEGEVEDGSIVVTFDDGLLGVYQNALPRLHRYKVPAAVFVVEDFTRSGKSSHGKPTLSVDQIRGMAKLGITVGSHSRTHLSLGSAHLNEEQLSAETLGAKNGLEALLDIPIRHFAYPYGTRPDVTPQAVEAIRQAGYELALTSVHGKIERGADPLMLRRIKVERADSTSTFKELLCGGMDGWAWIDTHASWLQATRREQ